MSIWLEEYELYSFLETVGGWSVCLRFSKFYWSKWFLLSSFLSKLHSGSFNLAHSIYVNCQLWMKYKQFQFPFCEKLKKKQNKTVEKLRWVDLMENDRLQSETKKSCLHMVLIWFISSWSWITNSISYVTHRLFPWMNSDIFQNILFTNKF